MIFIIEAVVGCYTILEAQNTEQYFQERLQQELKGFSSQVLCCICYMNCEGVHSGEFNGGSIRSMILLYHNVC